MKGFIWGTGWCLQRLCLVPPAPGKPACLAGKKHLLTRFPAEQRNSAWGPFFAPGVQCLISSEQTRTVMAETAWVLHLQHSLATGNLPCHRNTALWEHMSFYPGNDLGSAFTPDCFHLSFKNNTQEITSVHDSQTPGRWLGLIWGTAMLLHHPIAQCWKLEMTLLRLQPVSWGVRLSHLFVPRALRILPPWSY